MRTVLTIALLALAAVPAGCGDDEDGASDGTLRVVATTTQLGDFAREVGGDGVRVDTLLGPGTDPHDYEPRPSDARAVAEADVVLRSGGTLDGWLGDLLDSAGSGAEELTLIDVVDQIPGDPHWWQDPRNAERAAARIAVAFRAAAPDDAETFARRARAYTGRIRDLDGELEDCIDSVPAERRKLVTGHDSFAYLARRYEIEVLGAIVPGRSTASQPSAGDVRDLVRRIRREDVDTIFPERALSARLERAVAREAGAEVGEPLYADTLGPPGSAGDSYVRALRHDALAIARGFGARCPS